MQLKNYQQQTLDTLSNFLTEAKIFGIEEAFKRNRNAPSYSADYFKLQNLEGVPYVCLEQFTKIKPKCYNVHKKTEKIKC